MVVQPHRRWARRHLITPREALERHRLHEEAEAARTRGGSTGSCPLVVFDRLESHSHEARLGLAAERRDTAARLPCRIFSSLRTQGAGCVCWTGGRPPITPTQKT